MRILLFCVFISILSCHQSSNSLGTAQNFFPNTHSLKDGLVWKYYFHQKHENWNDPKTDILYVEYRMENENLLVTDYDAAFNPKANSTIQVNNTEWRLMEEQIYEKTFGKTVAFNKISATIAEDGFLNWGVTPFTQVKSYQRDRWNTKATITQNEIVDTLVDGQAKKIFKGIRVWEVTPKEDTTTVYDFKWSQEWTKGMGMTAYQRSSDNWELKMELVEIMTKAEFENRSDHGTHRVAWIDPENTLDNNPDFKPCFAEEGINDYYNDNDAKFIGGKGKIRALLTEHLNPDLLGKESGYLTFRFVVNCKGETGRFITEEANLKYEPKKFSQECVNHLFSILKEHGQWSTLKIGKEQEAYDAYTYLTFKLKDGKIIELLPQ